MVAQNFLIYRPDSLHLTTVEFVRRTNMRVTVGNSGLGLAGAGLMLLTACNPPSNDQQLKEQAAQATEQAKQTAKDALAQTKVAAANAEQAVNDVAAGVKQGLDTKSSPSDNLVDLNTA